MMKKMIGVIAIVGGMAVGEYVQPYTSIKDLMEFHNVPIASNSPVDPWNYEVRRELVEDAGKTYQGLYLVNDVQGIHKKIDEGGCTCSVKSSIDEFVQDAKEWVGEKVEATKNWFSDLYEDLSD